MHQLWNDEVFEQAAYEAVIRGPKLCQQPTEGEIEWLALSRT